MPFMENKVQLITYVDRFGGHTLQDLRGLLAGPLQGVFGAVHILPFFLPIDGADAGFDPIDHTLVDPEIGDWSDVEAITKDVDVVADVIVNHMSVDSPQFQDLIAHGAESSYNRLFLTMEDVFPAGATVADLRAIYRPRPGLPFTKVRLSTGEERSFWTTFTPQQIDINVEQPQGQAYLDSILQQFHDVGIRVIRLDAIGYAVKRAGTSCFMLPETFEFVSSLARRAHELGMQVLVEVHSHYRRQIEVAKRVDWVYDFALPPLLLHAFAFRTGRHLAEWMRIRPKNALSVLDTHDGIGIVDIGTDLTDRTGRPGLVPPEDLAELVEIIHRRTNGESQQATGASASNLDLYQINSTFFDAMGRNEEQYLLARAIQFFLPGIPQVYYVGLLAGSNDMALLKKTGVGRDINRHFYSREEVRRELERPVVRRLVELIRLRNKHSAFAGNFEMEARSNSELALKWVNGAEWAHLVVNFEIGRGELRYTDGARVSQIDYCDTTENMRDILHYASRDVVRS